MKNIFIFEKMSIFCCFIWIFFFYCYNGEPVIDKTFQPELLEPLLNQEFHEKQKQIVFHWKLNDQLNNEQKKTIESIQIQLNGSLIAKLEAKETYFTFIPDEPFQDGIYTWSVLINLASRSYIASSTFKIDVSPKIIDHGLNNLQAYIEDYLQVSIEFSEQVFNVELNTSVQIKNEAALSEIETNNNSIYYFKIKNFAYGQRYQLMFTSAIKDMDNNSIHETSISFNTPQEFPQPKCIGWIGGGKDGWQALNGPFDGGSGDREFRDAQTISLSSDETMLYIADTPNERVQRWTKNGTYMGWIVFGEEGWQYGNTLEHIRESQIYGYFTIPSSAHCDHSGFIYVIYEGYRTIHKWNIEGKDIAWLIPGKSDWQTEPYNIEDFDDFDESFSNMYPFVDAQTDLKGSLFFIDYAPGFGRAIINKYSREGKPIGWIGCGEDGWQTKDIDPFCTVLKNTDFRFMLFPSGLAFDKEGNIYVSDGRKHLVMKWSKEGKAIGWIGHGKDGWQTGSVEYAEYGNHDYRSFSYPCGIAIDNVGNLFIADSYNHRVCKWTKDGKAVGWIGHGKDGWQTSDAPEYDPDSDGKGNMEYNRIPGAEGIAVDSHGTIYVSGTSSYGYNWRVSKWVMDDGEGGGGTPVEE